MRVLNDSIIIQDIKEEKVGNIYVSGNVNEYRRAKVIGYGEGRLLPNGDFKRLQVTQGDIVYYHEGAGVKVKDVRIIRESDIICVE